MKLNPRTTVQCALVSSACIMLVGCIQPSAFATEELEAPEAPTTAAPVVISATPGTTTAAKLITGAAERARHQIKTTNLAPDFTGIADYYADKFHGRKTASGAVHDKTGLMAAHRTLPFGTKVKLVNRRNHKSCVVVINDRGPFTKNRIIDVSKRAAFELGLLSGTRLVDCYVLTGRDLE